VHVSISADIGSPCAGIGGLDLILTITKSLLILQLNYLLNLLNMLLLLK